MLIAVLTFLSVIFILFLHYIYFRAVLESGTGQNPSFFPNPAPAKILSKPDAFARIGKLCKSNAN